ncbi:MAG: phospholipase D family protein [Pseudomonadota bacterium]|nr:phospholipase D family protein [Pseudomonadota bacterium]
MHAYRTMPVFILVSLLTLQGCQRLPDRPDHHPQLSQPLAAMNSLSPPLTTLPQPSLAQQFQQHQSQHPDQSALYLLQTAKDAFVSRVFLLRHAQHSVELQYYIWEDDLIGRLLLAEVLHAANRGVRIRLILDDHGSRQLDGMLIALAQHPNIDIRMFNPFAYRTWRWLDFVRNFQQQQKRMHNKAMIVDDTFLITGGRNIGNAYFRTEEQSLVFADVDIIAAGQPAITARQWFNQYWQAPDSYPIQQLVSYSEQSANQHLQRILATQARDDAQRYLQQLKETHFVQQLLQHDLQWSWGAAQFISDRPDKIHQTNPAIDSIPAQIAENLNKPKQQLDLISAYFLPSDRDVADLKRLVDRGVTVRILTNSLASTDVPPVHGFYAMQRPVLLDAGVKLYEYRAEQSMPSFGVQGAWGERRTEHGSLHAKIFQWDLRHVFIGSFNLDPRSLLQNTECGLLIDSPELAQRIDQGLDEKIDLSAYRVEYHPEQADQLIWIAQDNDQTTVLEHEPQASVLSRLIAYLTTWFPIAKPYL